ncbi:MAG TPA: SpoIID/LytB domain-containing protein [Dermatophilaceae bacterium]
MRLAERARVFRALSLGLTGALVGSVMLAAAPAGADEVYVRAASTVTLSGHGYGHGHGMSQWGAYGAAAVKKLSWRTILAFYYPGTKLANLGNPAIRVRLDVVSRTVMELPAQTGLRLAGQTLPGTIAGARVTGYRVRSRSAGGLLVYAHTAAGWKLYKTAGAPAVFSSPGGKVTVVLASGTSRAYRGSLVANRTSSTSILPVSVLPMESYLRAVVPAEMPASWHPNALRSQAVAARSYASFDRARATAGRTWDTCDTTSCQMYSGVPAEYAASDSAVAATAGQTLTYGGKAAFTQFGSSNGGWTSTGSQPYLTARADPYDGAIPNGANAWTNAVTAARIQARWPSIGTYRQLRIIRRDGHGAWGGRVLTAAIEGSAGSVAVTGATIRSAFGLRSEWFVPNGGSAAGYVNDFNGDGKPDVLGVVAATGALRMYAGNGASGWKSTSVIGAGFGGLPKVFTAGAWNADASSDVMAQKSDGTLWLYPGSATGALSPGRQVPGSSWDMYNKIIPAGDFSGDGHPDLIARKPDGTLVLYCGDGAGGFVGAARVIGSGWDTFTAVLSPGDFTGDRKADVIARTSRGLLYLYPGNGSGGWLSPRLIGQGWNAFSAIISSGDFNGDGKSDLLGRGRDGALWMYPGNGTGGFLRAKVVGTGWNLFSVILP